MKWIEAYGTGILKIKEAYAKYDIKPIFEITKNAFKVTLPAIKIKSQSKQQKIHFNDSEMKIVHLLSEKNEIKRKDVESAVGVSQPMAVKLIKGLREKNVIEKIGNGKNSRYRKK